jgi:uncharacterized membrane protein
MNLLWLLVVFALIGLGAWALVSFVPMPSAIATVIVVVAVIGCVLMAINAFRGAGPPNRPVI